MALYMSVTMTIAECLGSLQSLDWNGGMEWWNGIVECVLQGERSLLLQFFSSC